MSMVYIRYINPSRKTLIHHFSFKTIDLGGNTSTIFMLIFALIGGVMGAGSVLVGYIHFRSWRNESLATASSLAIVSWAITALTFGYTSPFIIYRPHEFFHIYIK